MHIVDEKQFGMKDVIKIISLSEVLVSEKLSFSDVFRKIKGNIGKKRVKYNLVYSGLCN